jgi:hypothetical protein
MLLKSKQDAEEFVFWCVTLRCEVLPQGFGRLQTSIGYCCLGTGIACTIPELKLDKIGGELSYCCPDSQHSCPEWLAEISNVKFQRYNNRRLYGLNDELKLSHKEIGTLLLGLYEEELNYWL